MQESKECIDAGARKGHAEDRSPRGMFLPPYCWLLLDDQTRSRISHIECHRNMTKAEAIVYFTNRGFTNVRAD